MAINDRVDNPEHWSRINMSLKNSTLMKQNKPLNSTESKPQALRISSNNNSSNATFDPKPVCFQYNRGHKCKKSCFYRHVCQSCKETHPISDYTCILTLSGSALATNTISIDKQS